MTRALHRVRHWLGWNTGYIVSVTWRGTIWMGYRCACCGKVLHKAPAGQEPPDEVFIT